MKDNKISNWFRKLQQNLKPMTFSQKIDHLWTYYKYHLWILALFLIFAAAGITGIINAGKEVMISGVIVNVGISNKGYSYLSDEYADVLNIDKKQSVELTYVQFTDPQSAENVSENYQAAMKIVAMISAKNLDYMIMDRAAMEFYMDQDIYMDLREMFSEEQLAQWASILIYAQPEGVEEMFPVAIDVSQLEFVKDTVSADGPVYLLFAANSPRITACKEFWEYLNN